MNPNMISSISEFKTLLGGAKSVAVLLPQDPTVDAVSSALSLYLALSLQGKQISVVCSTPMTVEFNRLVGVDKISGNLSAGEGKNLVIAFPYEEGSIEKVSYNIDAGYFNLVIEPREDYPLITPEMLKYSFGGGNIDLIIAVGASSLELLGSIYQNNQNQFNEKTVINIDVNSINQNYGKLNIVDPNFSTISELMVSVFNQLGYQPDADVGTNLLAGIVAATNNFTGPTTTPGTFETIATLMRMGARMLPPLPVNPPPMPNFNRPSSSPSYGSQPPVRPKNTWGTPPRQNVQQPQSVRKPFNPPQLPRTPPGQSKPPSYPASFDNQYGSQTNQYKPAGQPSKPAHQETPPDWLKPKIYKGTSTS